MITRKIRGAVKSLEVGENIKTRLSAYNVRTARMILSKHPHSFKTSYKRGVLSITRVPDGKERGWYSDHVRIELGKVKSHDWVKINLGSGSAAAFRNLMPSGIYKTKLKNGVMYARLADEKSYRETILEQLEDLDNGESKVVDTLGKSVVTFRATLPTGEFMTRDLGRGKMKVTRRIKMSDEEYAHWVTKMMFENDVVELLPFKHMKSHVTCVCEMNGIRVKWLGPRTIRVYKATAMLGRLKLNQTMYFSDEEIEEVANLMFYVGYENFKVTHYKELSTVEVTRIKDGDKR